MENNKRTCVLCKKKIKKFAKWNDGITRQVHRSCWLNFRDYGDRYADFLFCPDRTTQNKVIVVEPKSEEKKE